MYKKIYDEMFKIEDYNMSSIEAEPRFMLPLKIIKKFNIKNIIDIGSGRGILLEEIIKNYSDIKITSIDLNKYNLLDIDFIELDITKDTKWNIKNKYDLLICTDCLEHIEQEYLDDIINWFSNISSLSFISVANHDEYFNICGKRTNLHITKEKNKFWENLISKYFDIVFNLEKEDIWYFFLAKSKINA